MSEIVRILINSREQMDRTLAYSLSCPSVSKKSNTFLSKDPCPEREIDRRNIYVSFGNQSKSDESVIGTSYGARGNFRNIRVPET